MWTPRAHPSPICKPPLHSLHCLVWFELGFMDLDISTKGCAQVFMEVMELMLMPVASSTFFFICMKESTRISV